MNSYLNAHTLSNVAILATSSSWLDVDVKKGKIHIIATWHGKIVYWVKNLFGARGRALSAFCLKTFKAINAASQNIKDKYQPDLVNSFLAKKIPTADLSTFILLKNNLNHLKLGEACNKLIEAITEEEWLLASMEENTLRLEMEFESEQKNSKELLPNPLDHTLESPLKASLRHSVVEFAKAPVVVDLTPAGLDHSLPSPLKAASATLVLDSSRPPLPLLTAKPSVEEVENADQDEDDPDFDIGSFDVGSSKDWDEPAFLMPLKSPQEQLEQQRVAAANYRASFTPYQYDFEAAAKTDKELTDKLEQSQQKLDRLEIQVMLLGVKSLLTRDQPR